LSASQTPNHESDGAKEGAFLDRLSRNATTPPVFTNEFIESLKPARNPFERTYIAQ
jgi:hypothetical protein